MYHIIGNNIIYKEPKKSIIPLKIFQTWSTKNLPKKMNENIINLKKDNPEFEYFLYDDNDCREFIKNNFSEEVLDTFNILIPGAYKADLWRLCILYIYGGIYLDIKYKCINNFKLIYLTDNEYLVMGSLAKINNINNQDKNLIPIHNGLMICLPKNDLLLKGINKIVDNTKNKYFGYSPLWPTGPIMLGKLVLQYKYKYNYNLRTCEHICNKCILTHYKEYRQEQNKNSNNKHYSTLWNNRNIYDLLKIHKIWSISDLPKKSIIPLKIFQTWNSKNLPEKMNENMINLKKNNPEFEYFLYDDNDCRLFIKENFSKEILDTFNTLRPGAYKADLWRLCVLYINGGIYLDIKYKCINQFKFIYLTNKEYFVKDRYNVKDTNLPTIYNALIICLPNNNLLLEGINQIIKNTKNKFYGYNPLCPTGPVMLGKIASKYNLELDLRFSGNAILYNELPVVTSYDEYRAEQEKCQTNKHYSILWKEKNIYVDPTKKNNSVKLILNNKTNNFVKKILMTKKNNHIIKTI